MKHNYLKAIICVALLVFAVNTKAQTAFSETFGTGVGGTFPAGWTLNDGDWGIDDGTSVPACTVAASSGAGLMYGADGVVGVQRSISRPFSTLAFSSMTLAWNGYRSIGAPTLTLEIRYNNSNLTGTVGSSGWTVLSFTDVATDADWHALAVTLPVAAEGQSSVYIRWSYTGANGGNFIAFDDVTVTGISTPVFYWDGVGAINQLGSWSDVIGGGGINPGSFTSNDQFFNMLPVGGTNSVTLSGAWTIGGNNTVLNIGDGVAPFTFAINSTLTFAAGASPVTRMVVMNTSSVVLLSTASSTIAAANVNLNTGSTVEFAQTSTVNLWGGTYSNLTISGGADKSQNGGTTVNGILNLSSSLVMSNSSLTNLNLNGSVTGAGMLKTGNSKLNIVSTGNFGTLTFGVGSTTRTVNQLNVNITSSGLLTLGSDITATGVSTFPNGQVNLNGKSLTLNGAVTFPNLISNGSFIGSSTSSLTIGGAGAITNNLFFDQTSASTRSMRDVTLNRSGGVTLTLGNALEISGSLNPSVGTIASGSNLTLKSTASAKGRIGIISATGFFTGSPRVEVFHTAGLTGWVNLCSGGVTGQTMSNWNTSFAITCSNCPITDVGGSPFTSIYAYDETTLPSGNAADANHYIGIDATGGLGTSINSYKGYWVYLGDGQTNTNAITIPLTGAVNTKASGGSYNLTLTGGVNVENGWSLISNPYPSPILVSQIIASAGGGNIDNTLLSFDPNTNGNAPFTAAGTNSVIPMGQGFMIRTLVNNLTLTPAETWKTTTSSSVNMFKPAAAASYYFNDFMLSLTSANVNVPFFAQAYFTFNNGNTNSFDNGQDAFSLASSVDPGTPRIISIVGGSDYMRNALPALTGTVVIPVKVATGYAGVYSINPINLNKLPAGACVNLYHISTGVTHNLRTGAYTTTLSANAASNQFELRITVNAANLTSTTADPVCKSNNTGFIKATGTTAGPWNYTWKDVNSNVVRTMSNMVTADTLKNIYEGTYYVDINTVGSCDNAGAVFNLLATTPAPVALFSANTNSVNDMSNIPVTFINNSTNAVNYTWDFGDGTNAATPNASHVFLGEGSNYMVTLTANNGPCNDVSVASTMIEVRSQGPVNITQHSFEENTLFVSRDENGVFVQFNFDEVTKADVNVTNILGQVIIAKQQINGDKSKTYLTIPENEKVIFVTVATDNKKQTVKIIN